MGYRWYLMVEGAVVGLPGEVVAQKNRVEVEVEGVMKVAQKSQELGVEVEAVLKQCRLLRVFRSSCGEDGPVEDHTSYE